ncbi:hypothetical protein ACQKWADRAFT_290902 [Trichoderma austrokoningii]
MRRQSYLGISPKARPGTNMRCFCEFWGGVFFYCPKVGTSPLNKGPAAVLAISCCAPPGSAAGRSEEYTTRGEKKD